MQFIESSTLELKRLIVDDIRKTVNAFANSEGGTIYIGIDDDSWSLWHRCTKNTESYKGFAAQPEFDVTDNAFKITLPNQNEQLQEAGPTSDEKRIIELAGRLGKLKRKDVESELNISQTMSWRILKGMVDKRILEIVGRGKNTVYVLRK